jgi:hypothetical protein
MRRLGLLVAWTLGACSIITNLGELSVGDAASDAQVSDSVVDVVDGSADAGRWCAMHTPAGGACFDFDEPDSDTTPHSTSCHEADGGQCAAAINVQSDNDSPPNALVLAFPALGPYPGSALAWETLDWPNNLTTATIAFDMRTTTADPTALMPFFEWSTIDFSMQLNGGALTLYADDYDVDSGVAPEAYNPMDGGVIDFRQWHRFALTVSTSAQTVLLTVDGVTYISDTTRNLPFGGYIHPRWGVAYVSNAPAAEYHLDNIVVSTSTM